MAPPFREGYVEADGFRIRYLEAGQGSPLVHLHGARGPRLTPAHDLLSGRHRVVILEMPGFGQSAENTRTRSMPELASTMAHATRKLGLETFNLLGTSFGGTAALWLALQEQARVLALVLEAPAAIRPTELPASSRSGPARPAAIAASEAAPRAETQALVSRLRGPARDPDLEGRLQELTTPTLVLLGTRDDVTPPEMGRSYKELIPSCHLVFVYDAAHGISTDRPEAFAEVVADFLERREAFVISRTATVIHP